MYAGAGSNMARIGLTGGYSWTHADNKPIIATDSIKNTIYILAKENPVTPPEKFAAVIGKHFNTKYAHIRATTV